MRTRKHRINTGSLIAEYATSLYILLFLLAFPLLNLSVFGFRAFFLWFAANQAVMAASKAKTYLEPIEIPPNTVYPSACQAAVQGANRVKAIFGGINWEETENNPDVQIVREPINPTAKGAKPEAVFTRGNGAPLIERDEPDKSTSIYMCRVIIKGYVSPLITLPWVDLPGLSKPVDLKVSSEAEYENISGLRI
jgi:hypothetical protein